ncbi:MAG: hypothetical protein LAQ69_09085 [Acidobacteriia bacterium]|nr:hypothetical protein [Terriglobia bacterium]
MNRFRNYVLMAAGFAVLAMVVGVFSVGPAIAQAVRAALVSNVDDPGRIPYQSQRICTFSGLSCLASFPVVLPGKRLVITHVSGQIAEDLPDGTLILAVLNLGNGGSIFMPVTFTGNSAGLNYFVFDQSTLLSYDTGQFPRPSVILGRNPPTEGLTAVFTLTGYMLDCNTGPCVAIAP